MLFIGEIIIQLEVKSNQVLEVLILNGNKSQLTIKEKNMFNLLKVNTKDSEDINYKDGDRKIE